MLPRELGTGSASHSRFQEWNKLDVFKKMWIRLLNIYHDSIGINWAWQSIDSISIKSQLGGAMTGNNPTDRNKLGTKRHILTDKKGIPLSAVVSSASTNDINLVTEVVDNAVVRIKRRDRRQHLCLDKGYKSEQEEQKLIKQGYVLHVPIKKKKGEDSEEK